MFSRTTNQAEIIKIFIDGEEIEVRRGDTVAAALLFAKKMDYRASQINGEPRAPYCMTGHCFECLVEINGRGNRQGCLVPVKEGMQIKRQYARPEVKP